MPRAPRTLSVQPATHGSRREQAYRFVSSLRPPAVREVDSVRSWRTFLTWPPAEASGTPSAEYRLGGEGRQESSVK